jgi:hypothetical protein
MRLIRQDRYTRHEVTAPREVGPSGRTYREAGLTKPASGHGGA